MVEKRCFGPTAKHNNSQRAGKPERRQSHHPYNFFQKLHYCADVKNVWKFTSTPQHTSWHGSVSWSKRPNKRRMPFRFRWIADSNGTRIECCNQEFHSEML